MKLQPEVKVIKSKNGLATVIEVWGFRYQLQHPDHYKPRSGGK